MEDRKNHKEAWWVPDYHRLKSMILYGIFFYSPVNVWFFYNLNPWYMSKWAKLFPKFLKGAKVGSWKYSLMSIFTQKYIVIWPYIPSAIFSLEFLSSFNFNKSVVAVR